jgi:DNA-directed RNA polymerase specialized sigma24 family protein
MARRAEQIAARYSPPSPTRGEQASGCDMKKTRLSVDRKRLERAAAELTDIEREVLIRTAREGRWTREMAQGLGLTPEQFEHHLADAIVKFTRALAKRSRAWWRFG